MDKHTKIFKIILSFTISVSFLLLISCKDSKTEQPKIENVCTLTPEQFPEIRGFRLGMSLDQILKKYPPTFCKSNNPKPETSMSVSIYLLKDSETSTSCFKYDSYNSIPIYKSQHSELNGISKIELEIKANSVSKISVEYETTSDQELSKVFHDKVKETLGLAEWTNWKTTNESPFSSQSNVIEKIEINTLLCNKVSISTRMTSTLIFRNGQFTDNITTYAPKLIIEKTNEVAMSTAQKQQIANQIANQKEEAKRIQENEDRKKTETFKP